MLVIKNNRIYLTRGDTATLQLTLENQDGKAVKIEPGDTLVLTVKKLASDINPLIQLTADESGQFAIEPADTEGLKAGVYMYDIQMNREGNIYTVIPSNYFELKEEITR